jgi:hypothetical protein
MRRITLLSAFLLGSFVANAQTVVSTFDDLSLAHADTFYVNYSSSGADVGFNDGLAHFPSIYEIAFGDTSWSYFSYSNMTDSVTSGLINQYSAKTAIGYGGSANYVVASCFNPFTYENTVPLNLTGGGAGISRTVSGFYVTNNTYAYNSMKNGDMFARKFHNGDWFKLTVFGYSGALVSDSVSIYLADFLYPDTTMNYILKTWEWVNLLPLGNVDSLHFSLTSSDNSIYGMNTPAYFCMDNFTVNETSLGVKNPVALAAKVYPNPSTDMLNIDLQDNSAKQIQIQDMAGNIINSYPVSSNHIEVDTKALAPGVYLLVINGNGQSANVRFVKQ